MSNKKKKYECYLNIKGRSNICGYVFVVFCSDIGGVFSKAKKIVKEKFSYCDFSIRYVYRVYNDGTRICVYGNILGRG